MLEKSSPSRPEFTADPTIGARLRSGIGGLVFEGSRAEAEAYAEDFGGWRRRVPQWVVEAASPEDVAFAMAVAEEFGLPVAFRGAGLCSGGQALTEGLVVRKCRPFSDPVLKGGLLRVDGAATWRRVLDYLEPRSFTAPVTTSYLDATVAGTLSVGGYGVWSVSQGAQIDHVTALEIVDGEGLRWVRRGDATFARTLAGVGQGAFINRVEMSVVALREPLRLIEIRRSCAAGVAEAVTSLLESDGSRVTSLFSFTDRRDRLVGNWRLFVGGDLTVGPVGAELVIPDSARAMDADVCRWLGAYPDTLKLWGDYIVPASGLTLLCDLVDAIDDEAGRFLAGVYFLAAPPAPRWRFGLGTYFMLPSSAPRYEFDRIRHFLGLLRETALTVGGAVYPYGFHGSKGDS